MKTPSARRPSRAQAPHPARDWGLAALVTGVLLAAGAWALSRSGDRTAPGARSATLPYGLDALAAHQRPMPEPRPGDWLAEHDEGGESFEAWAAAAPVVASGDRRVLYVQPLGDFESAARRIVTLTADYMARYFSLEVRVLPDLPLARIPARARRVHPQWGDRQVLAPYVLDRVLKPALPADAAALIAFTSSDLWPGDGWNYVFGLASFRDRVGVWSIYRNGDPSANAAAFRLCLRRTCQTATHETGHMFSMRHCIAYACNMNGSNHRAEADGQPMACCPECVAKLCAATGAEPRPRYRTLFEFCRAEGLSADASQFERCFTLLGARSDGP